MKKLAIIITHPIQYYTPVFMLLHSRRVIEIRVFYTWGEKALTKFDPGFNKTIEWDIPLLDDYPYEWVKNISKDPGSHHFNGIITPGLTTQVEAWQPDAVLIYGWGYHGHLRAIRYFKNKIPVLFRGDSTLLDEKKEAKALFKFIFLSWVYRHVDHAFYVGGNNKAYFKKYGLKEGQLSFAPHAIDNKRFAGDKGKAVPELRESLGLKDEEILIMFAGKLEDKKDPELLLKAFLNLNRPGLHLLFVGNGMLEEKLKLNAKNNPTVHFKPFQNQSQMPALLQACDLFCLPSKGPGESWGLAVNEAMACKKAILVSDKVGCATDLVKNEFNGRIFQSGNMENLMLYLAEMTQSKELLATYGEHSATIIKDWDFETMASVIENKLLHEA